MLKPARWLVVFLFALAVGGALASRNTAGTYSLPSGNPVVSGTTITSSWANGTLGDLATELTNSLDRQGRGAMLAPLQLASGTSAAPGLTFSAEQSTGLYRAGLNDIRMQVNSSQVQRWQPALTTFSTAISVTANTSGSGVTSTGSGSFSGVVGTSGATGGFGVLGEAGSGSGGSGVHGDGDGSGFGVQGFGGFTSGTGGDFEGGSPNGIGLQALGAGTGVGGRFTAGTTSTGASPTDAIKATNGNINLDGVANPDATVALKNRVTPKNIAKAWGAIGVGGAVSDGFNVTSASLSGSTFTVTIAQACNSSNLSVLVTANCAASTTSICLAQAHPTSSSTFTVDTFFLSTTPSVVASAKAFSFVAFCAQ